MPKSIKLKFVNIFESILKTILFILNDKNVVKIK